jgi:hypothetical protein
VCGRRLAFVPDYGTNSHKELDAATGDADSRQQTVCSYKITFRWFHIVLKVLVRLLLANIIG